MGVRRSRPEARRGDWTRDFMKQFERSMNTKCLWRTVTDRPDRISCRRSIFGSGFVLAVLALLVNAFALRANQPARFHLQPWAGRTRGDCRNRFGPTRRQSPRVRRFHNVQQRRSRLYCAVESGWVDRRNLQCASGVLGAAHGIAARRQDCDRRFLHQRGRFAAEPDRPIELRRQPG